MTLAFIIDTDHVTTGADSDAGFTRGDEQRIAELRTDPNTGRPFRLYDDDRELYYEGRILTADDPGTEQDFAPLDWAMWNAGCTAIMYCTHGAWWVL